MNVSSECVDIFHYYNQLELLLVILVCIHMSFCICSQGTLHISSKHYMGPTLFMELGPKTPPEKADFAMKQTNICRLSGDINKSRHRICVKIWRLVMTDRVTSEIRLKKSNSRDE